MNAKLNPGWPAALAGVKSVELGSFWYTSTLSDVLTGARTASPNSRIIAPLSAPVSNIDARPPPPRASRLTTTPTRRASGSRAKNAFAPSSPSSSPSVSSTIRSRFGAPPAVSARTVSRITATPAPSSAAPGDPQTLS